jgi:hypothetical protein
MNAAKFRLNKIGLFAIWRKMEFKKKHNLEKAFCS